jgi:hypothetical protein
MKILYLSKDFPSECFYSLNEVAKSCGRTRHAFLKLISRGIMPDSNFRGTKKIIHSTSTVDRIGKVIPGERLYSILIVADLVSFFRQVHKGKKINYEQKEKLIRIFLNERKHFKIK